MGGAPSLILPNLWLGGQDVINDPKFFSDRKICYVLSLGPAAPHPRIPLKGREHINIPDMPNADLGKHLAKAVRFIAEGRHNQNCCVYVHCAAGISRSTTCMCAYFMVHLGCSFHEALSFIASRRKAVCPNEGFTRQLKRFEASKERQELTEELARQCKFQLELKKSDLDEMNHGEGSAVVGQVPRPLVAGGGNTPSIGAYPGAGSPLMRFVAPHHAPQRRPSNGNNARGQQQLSNVEQEQQQHAMKAVRGAMSQYQRENATNQGPGQNNPDGLRIGNGDAKGDVGLSWLLRPLAAQGDAAPPAGAGRGSASVGAAARGPTGSSNLQGPTGSRRGSNSQPAGRRVAAYR